MFDILCLANPWFSRVQKDHTKSMASNQQNESAVSAGVQQDDLTIPVSSPNLVIPSVWSSELNSTKIR